MFFELKENTDNKLNQKKQNRCIDKFILSTKRNYPKEPNRNSEAEKYNECRSSLDGLNSKLDPAEDRIS